MNQVVLFAVALSAVALQVNFAVSEEQNATAPLSHPAKVIFGEGQGCPTEEQLKMAMSQFEEELDSLLDSILPTIEETIPQSIQEEETNMSACGGPGWTRIVYLNMGLPSHECPDGWMEYTTSLRLCGRPASLSQSASVTYSSQGTEYQKVCGRARGYQFGQTTAFSASSDVTADTPYYVDGISITHGQEPRQHIWSFASGLREGYLTQDSFQVCPCANPNPAAYLPPSFVGNNYFCESGTETYDTDTTTLYSSDPLWDGQGCGEATMCCSFNSPPWFMVEVSAPTTDDIEVRICDGNAVVEYGDTRVELLEIYVQ